MSATTILILLFFSVILNLVFGYMIWKFVYFTIPDRESVIDQYEDFYTQMKEYYQKTYESMRRIDLRGAFESDDEVGVAFKFIYKSIEQIDELFEIKEKSDAKLNNNRNLNQTKK